MRLPAPALRRAHGVDTANARGRRRAGGKRSGCVRSASADDHKEEGMTRLRPGSLTAAATLATLVLSAAPAAPQAVGTLDHLACYAITDPLKVDATVDLLTELQPEFRQAGCRIIKASKFCVPTTKVVVQATTTGPGVVGQPLRDDYICYRIKCPDTAAPIPSKLVADQFGQR
jgi:hypothetical protein